MAAGTDARQQRPLTTVTVESGVLEGVSAVDAGITVFKGIPFAAPPVGNLRWRPPQPPAAWEGVRRAASFGPICPQFGPQPGSFYHEEFYLQPETQSEDCLYLNVWTAAESSAERRPVMVWFHGGAFLEGSGSLPSFHGETLVRKGVVLVTVNYRLGFFGYLAHPALSAESGQGVSGNYGLLDQIAALQWVNRNIAAFGGDPAQVTIFGQSAGSMSVFALLISPLAAGLFQRAIGQSGSPFTFREMKTLRDAEQAGVERAAAWGTPSLAEMRALSTAQVLGEWSPDLFLKRPGLAVDGWAIPGDPAELMAAGRCHPVALLVGATADEMTPMGATTGVEVADFQQQANQQYGADAAAFLKLYPAATAAEALRAQIASRSDQMFAGMRYWASRQLARNAGPAYVYYFDRRLPGRNSEFYGAFHSGDLYYAFGTLHSTERPWEDADHRLADAMTSYWANFATHGDPNGPGLPVWPAYDRANDQVMELGARVGVIAAPKQPQLVFFDQELARRFGQ